MTSILNFNPKRRDDQEPQRAPGQFTVPRATAPAPAPAFIPPPPAPPPPQGPQPPALEQFDQYKTGNGVWRGIPYGSAEWTEGGNNLIQDLDLDVPSGALAMPPGGWPLVVYYHANGSTKTVPPTGTLATAKAEILAAGFAFATVEFRHPVVNVDLGAPHTDVGLSVQYLRALATPMQLDKDNFFGMARSRGSLCLWQSLQPDMAQANAPTWEGRQSSWLQAILTHAAQTTYDTEEFAELFVIAGAQRAAFLAAYPNDARWGSALSSIATAPNVPHLKITHVDAYPVGQVNANQVNEHYAGFGSEMRDRYIANGHTAKVTASDLVPDLDAWIGAAAWFTSKLV